MQRMEVRVFKFYPSVLLLMNKTSQSAREKLDSFVKKTLFKTKRKTYLSFQVSNAYTWFKFWILSYRLLEGFANEGCTTKI